MATKQILSPLPGTFYRKPSPDEPAFKEVGDEVAPGEVVGIVEVMKSFNQVIAEESGKITAFLAEDEDAVMPGQPLVELDG
jgi:acetyl-CoA carboxylase biotin carboxyl carrier protein